MGLFYFLPVSILPLGFSLLLVNCGGKAIGMNDIEEIIEALIRFRNERDWEQFHDSKNLATAISIEAAELNELFLWKTIKESEEVDKEKIKEELADILSFCFLLAEKHNLDIKQVILDKVKMNALKYPVDKAKGNAKKYNEL